MNIEGKIDIEEINLELEVESSKETIRKAFEIYGDNAVVSTSFKDYSAVFVSLLCKIKPDARVILVDTGYLTLETLDLAGKIQEDFNLDLRIYRPEQRYIIPFEQIPKEEEELRRFCNKIKVEPFERALEELNAGALITGALNNKPGRENLEAVRIGRKGIVEFRPMIRWNTKMLYRYAKRYSLPINENYRDICTGEDGKRECGIFGEGI